MKTAFAWTEQATYENARAALFGYASTVMLTHCKKSVNNDFTNTWTWLKKKMLAIFGNVNDIRSMIDILQGIKPKTNIHENMLNFVCEIDQEFDKISTVLDKPEVPVPAAGHYTREETQQYCEDTAARIVEQFNMGFMVIMLPPTLRTKVIEKNPRSVTETLRHVQECQKLILDEKRPTGIAGPTPSVHQVDELPDDQLEHLIQVLQKRRGQPASRGSRGNNRGSRGNNRSSNIDRSALKCSHCHRTGHGVVECWNRIENELPCYNQKGEAYYPPTDKAKREELLQKKKKTAIICNVAQEVSNEGPNDDSNSTSIAEPAPKEAPTRPGQTVQGDSGSDFQVWV
jgi:hypothetical protein